MSEDEMRDMVEAHRQASWRQGFISGFVLAGVAVLCALAISSVYLVVVHPKDATKVEVK